MAPRPDKFAEATKDFDRALQNAQAAINATTDPAMRNLILALANYSRSTTDVLIVMADQLDEIERQVKNVGARLDGKPGPFSLKMR